MKRFLLAALTVLALAVPAAAANKIGFKNWSAATTQNVPVTCSYEYGTRAADGFQVEGIGSVALATKTTVKTVTLSGPFDYYFQCVRDSTGLAYPVKVFLDNYSSGPHKVTDQFVYRRK